MTFVVHEDEPFSLEPVDSAFALARLGGFVRAHHGGKVSVARLVGHVRLPSGETLHIRSRKAPAASVLAWLAYVDPTLSAVDWSSEVSSASDSSDVGALLAHLFLSELRRAFTRFGVPRVYRSAQVVSSVVRGRIEFTQLARSGGDLSRLPCTVWERRPLTKAIQTLAAVVEIVRNDSVMRQASPSNLRSVSLALAEVPAKLDMETLSGKTPLGRNELGLTRALKLAKLIVDQRWLGDAGSEQSIGYLVNLEELFEKTVIRALTEGGIHVRPKDAAEYRRGPSETGRGSMELDAFCPELAARGVVVDAKYKTAISAGNLQQMVAYCFMTGARTAVLVVPGGHIQDRRTFTFRDRREAGESPIRVHIVELATNGDCVNAWRRAGADMVGKLRVAVGGAVEHSAA